MTPSPARRLTPNEGFNLPIIAIDLTGLAVVIVAIYAVSYAYYLNLQIEGAEAMEAAKKKRAAKAKE